MINIGQFKAIFPNCPVDKAKLYLPLLISAMREFQITTRKRAAALFSQLGHESSDLARWSENLNYTASRLEAVFPKYFNAASAARAAHRPEVIANIVYGGRMGDHSPRLKAGASQDRH